MRIVGIRFWFFVVQLSGLPREVPCNGSSVGLNICPFTTAEILQRLSNEYTIFPPWTTPSYRHVIQHMHKYLHNWCHCFWSQLICSTMNYSYTTHNEIFNYIHSMTTDSVFSVSTVTWHMPCWDAVLWNTSIQEWLMKNMCRNTSFIHWIWPVQGSTTLRRKYMYM